MNRYTQGIVDTNTPIEWFVFINVVRTLLSIYVVYKYAMMNRKIEGETKKRVQWFFIGIIFAIVGMFINLIGGFLSSIIIEIIALLVIDIGTVALFKGFLIK